MWLTLPTDFRRQHSCRCDCRRGQGKVWRLERPILFPWSVGEHEAHVRVWLRYVRNCGLRNTCFHRCFSSPLVFLDLKTSPMAEVQIWPRSPARRCHHHHHHQSCRALSERLKIQRSLPVFLVANVPLSPSLVSTGVPSAKTQFCRLN